MHELLVGCEFKSIEHWLIFANDDLFDKSMATLLFPMTAAYPECQDILQNLNQRTNLCQRQRIADNLPPSAKSLRKKI